MNYFADVEFLECDAHQVQYLFKKLIFGSSVRKRRAPSNQVYLLDQADKQEKIPSLDGKNIISAVGCGYSASFLLTDAGELYLYGQLKPFMTEDTNSRCERLLKTEHVLQIAATNMTERAMALTSTKLIRLGKSWGVIDRNTDGVITSPHFHVSEIKKVQVGGVGRNDHMFVLLKNGQLYSMGIGCNYGELGRLDSFTDTLQCVTDGVDDVWGGGWHCHFTRRDGTLHAFGFNQDGRCGVGHLNAVPVPEEVKSMRNKGVISTANGCFSALLTREGHAYIAGTNSNISTFVRIRGLEDVFVTAIASGVYKIMALGQTGNLYATDTTGQYKEVKELKQFSDPRIIDIGAAGPNAHAVLLWI